MTVALTSSRSKSTKNPSWHVHFGVSVDLSESDRHEKVAAIRAVAQALTSIPITPHARKRLNSLNVIRAIRGTTGIEGIELTESEVAAVLDAEPGVRALSRRHAREEIEVRNAYALMLHAQGVSAAESGRHLTEELIREFHEVLTEGINYPNNVPGKYRRHFAVERGGSFIYPEPDKIPGLMTGFVDWVNRGGGQMLDPIIRAFAVHFLLLSIHPFGDANGRTARAVECYLLLLAGINVTGFYAPANYYYQNRNEYVDRLNKVRFESDPDIGPFIDFALEGMIAELEEVRGALFGEVRIAAFRDYAVEQLRISGRLESKPGERQLAFLLELGSNEVSFADVLGGRHPLALIHRHVGSRTLRRDLRELEKLNLIVLERGVIRAHFEITDQFAVWPDPCG